MFSGRKATLQSFFSSRRVLKRVLDYDNCNEIWHLLSESGTPDLTTDVFKHLDACCGLLNSSLPLPPVSE